MRKWTGTDTVRLTAVSRFFRHFDSQKIDKITTDDRRVLLRTWKKSTPATHNKYRAILASVFNFALIQNEDNQRTYITVNPVKPIRNKPLNNQRVRFFSDNEKQRLITACKTIGGRFYVHFLIAISTGMRKGNLLGLRWSDVYFTRGLLSIDKTKNGVPIHTSSRANTRSSRPLLPNR
ncbi:MAG: tyrosine-type recombinase/integrase [Gammaproteobacteria bacterium]|nr:tyrosine-type recombinase/integrase [Gammaproteobacteria bacterium]